MPVSDLQSRILRLLARHRDPESFVASSVPINRIGPRTSDDIDIFQDSADRVADIAHADATILAEAGYRVVWVRRIPSIQTARIEAGGEATQLDWVSDSDFRFFPAIPDQEFGYVLHMADLAMNKALAAAGRRELRDLVDLATLHERYLPLGAIALAAVETAPGFTPEGLLAELRRNTRYPAHDFAALDIATDFDPATFMRQFHAALDAAEAFVALMPSDKAGLLFLSDARPVQPDPARLGDYVEHRGARRGHWPRSPELDAAMLERYRRAGLLQRRGP